MDIHNRRPEPGDRVILVEVPQGLLKGLPPEDQEAILEIVGKAIFLVGYDSDGRAELEFPNNSGGSHTIWVEPTCIRSTG
jgi:hypothetical protein